MSAQPAELTPVEAPEETASNVIDISDKVGLVLTTARKQREMTLVDVSKVLHIRIEYLTAFEEDDYTDMPGTSYTQGFLKAYATFLGLDAEAVIRAVKAKGHLKDDVKHHIPQPIETNIMPSRTIILATLAVLVLLLAVWGIYALQPEEKPIPLAEEMTAVTPKQSETVLAEPAQAAAPEAIAAVQEEATPAPAEPVAEAAEEMVVEEAAEAAPQLEEEPVTTTAATTTAVELTFSDEVWLQMRSPTGKVYVNKVFKAGDTYTLPNKPGALLDIGKPSAVQVWIGGQEYTPWDKKIRRVLKDIPADADLLKQAAQ